jgi:hypothetical protein
LPVWGSPTTLVHNLCPSDSDDNAWLINLCLPYVGLGIN